MLGYSKSETKRRIHSESIYFKLSYFEDKQTGRLRITVPDTSFFKYLLIIKKHFSYPLGSHIIQSKFQAKNNCIIENGKEKSFEKI